MTYTSRSMFTVPLTSKAYKLANSFQTQYENPAKARQVYLNTLAVYAVNTYCQCLGIATDLEACDSLNSVMQPLMDIADLEIEGIGKLECRPVLPTDKDCYIPAETWEHRIGYVAVEIDESSREATLLGFYPPINALEMMEQVSLDDFQPLETFLDHLNRLESALDFFYSDDPVAVKARKRLTDQVFSEIIAQLERIYRTHDREEWRYAGGGVLAVCVTNDDRELLDDSQQLEVQELAEELLEKLDEIWRGDDPDSTGNTPIQAAATTASQTLANFGQWLQNIIEAGWQTVEEIFGTERANLIFATRGPVASGTVVRAKPIYLGTQPTGKSLALVAAVVPTGTKKRRIIIQVRPTDSKTLPPGLKSFVLDASGQIINEFTAKNTDNVINLNISGEAGEQLSLKLALDEASVTKDFFI